MKIEISLEKNKVNVGEEIPVKIKITNTSKEILYVAGLSGTSFDGLVLNLKNDRGEVLKNDIYSRPQFMSWGRGKGPMAVASGASCEITENLNSYIRNRVAGTFTLQGTMTDEESKETRSNEVSLTVLSLSDDILKEQISGLRKKLEEAKTTEERQKILWKLVYIGKFDVAQIFLDMMYKDSYAAAIVSNYMVPKYVDFSEDFRNYFLHLAKEKGLASSSGHFLGLISPPFSEADIHQIIQKSLASSKDEVRQEGAFVAIGHPDDRFMEKLVAMASDTRADHWNALLALTYNRTDKGVECLKRALKEESSRVIVGNYIKDAYLAYGIAHGYFRIGHPLRSSDFPEIKESQIMAEPISIEALITSHSYNAMTITTPDGKEESFPATYFKVEVPQKFKGKEFIVIHDSGHGLKKEWPDGAKVHLMLSAYYLENDVNVYEGALKPRAK